MNNNEVSTEQIILEAAETEFLEKGYSNAKMLSIAKRAGVAHSMLHYYFRSKENLFKAILLRKVHLLLPEFAKLQKQQLTFEGVMRSMREARDRYIMEQNPSFPYFILTEILTNRENRQLFLDFFAKEGGYPFLALEKLLQEEVEKGTIRPIAFTDFMLLLMTFDTASLSAIAICKESVGVDNQTTDKLLEVYREHNMQLILEALRP